jgi:cytochrome P450
LTTRPSPPGPPGLPFFGNVLDVWRDPVGILVESSRTYGSMVGLRFGPFRFFLVGDPDGIRHVLVDNPQNYKKSRSYDGIKLVLGQGLLTSEGELWRRQRRLIQPSFHRDRLAAFAGTMAEATSDMLDRWAPLAAERRAVNVHAEMMGLTLRIVASTFFGADVAEHAGAVAEALDTVIHFADEYVQQIVRLPVSLPTPRNIRFRRAVATLDRVAFSIQKARRRRGGGSDLLGMLMEARDEATGEPMSDAQIRDELMTLILAGHETTANALSWTFALLSQHPEAERRVFAEVSEVLGDRAPSLEDLGKLRYTTMVLQEAMRLYPPAWAFEREAIGSDEVAGYHVPPGTVILICPYTLHRDPKQWENPEGFEPERFSPERSAARPRYAYLPFGGGPRHCIGNGFAMMEAQIILAMVARRFRLWLCPGYPVEMEPLITLRPRGGVRVTLAARS